jgi:hypothetical protein
MAARIVALIVGLAAFITAVGNTSFTVQQRPEQGPLPAHPAHRAHRPQASREPRTVGAVCPTWFK